MGRAGRQPKGSNLDDVKNCRNYIHVGKVNMGGLLKIYGNCTHRVCQLACLIIYLPL